MRPRLDFIAFPVPPEPKKVVSSPLLLSRPPEPPPGHSLFESLAEKFGKAELGRMQEQLRGFLTDGLVVRGGGGVNRVQPQKGQNPSLPPVSLGTEALAAMDDGDGGGAPPEDEVSGPVTIPAGSISVKIDKTLPSALSNVLPPARVAGFCFPPRSGGIRFLPSAPAPEDVTPRVRQSVSYVLSIMAINVVEGCMGGADTPVVPGGFGDRPAFLDAELLYEAFPGVAYYLASMEVDLHPLIDAVRQYYHKETPIGGKGPITQKDLPGICKVLLINFFARLDYMFNYDGVHPMGDALDTFAALQLEKLTAICDIGKAMKQDVLARMAMCRLQCSQEPLSEDLSAQFEVFMNNGGLECLAGRKC